MSKNSVLKVEKNAHEDAIWSVSWRGLRIITGSACAASHVKVWETSAGEVFSLHPGVVVDCFQFPLAVVSVSQQRDGTAFVAGSLDGTLVSYNSVSAAGEAPVITPKVISTEPGCAWGASFNPAGGPLVATTGQNGALYLYDVSGTKGREKLQAASKNGTSVGWSCDGKMIAVGGMDGTATVFDIVNKKRLLTIPAHAKPVRAVRFSGDGQSLITAGDDGCINVRDINTGREIASITGHDSWVCALDTCAASPRTLVSGGADGTVRVWDLSANCHVHTFTEHHGQCWSVSLNDDGSKVASGGDDKSLVVYSLV